MNKIHFSQPALWQIQHQTDAISLILLVSQPVLWRIKLMICLLS